MLVIVIVEKHNPKELLLLLTMWLWRVLHWISHCAVRVFSTDMNMEIVTWAWTDMDLYSHQDMDMDMDMDTSGKQWIRFCTWINAMIERAMPWQR